MRREVVLLGLLLLALAVLVLAPFVGMQAITPADVLRSGGNGVDEAAIFWRLRVPRVLLAFLAGASLSLGGMIFQAVFRNDLATPFTLGVSSGAALGATLSLRLGLSFSLLGLDGPTLFALLGALLSMAVVQGLAARRPDATGATLLLAGVAVNFTLSSLILLVHYTSDAAQSFNILRWLMGRLDVVGMGSVLLLLPLFVVGGLAALLLHRELNLMTVGEEFAVSRGVDAGRTRTLLFLGTSLLVGGVVAVCGPIGFVGMMTPHVARLLVGADHRRLAPASILLGGILLTLCDLLARTLLAPAELPVGVITALLGGPFFLWLLTRSRSGVR
ncbi:MAG TPA: iron ABC transporter permease [Candidatus Krumholzibacteria bacterium]|nr:iron ABC transporter permease [Candidatus Krumholzibacteria bacterium]HRX51644.1 iron ABC transporter permease [Candidatus Krumholzibacteria bacterium]